jgi:outer membrane lipoprotein SlyB
MRSAPRYEIFVRMDDGRRLVVTQRELQGIRQGAAVQIRGNRAVLL